MAEVLRPLVEYYQRLLWQDTVLGCDDTSVTLIVPPVLPQLDPSQPRTTRFRKCCRRRWPAGIGHAWINSAKSVRFAKRVQRPSDCTVLFLCVFLGRIGRGFDSHHTLSPFVAISGQKLPNPFILMMLGRAQS